MVAFGGWGIEQAEGARGRQGQADRHDLPQPGPRLRPPMCGKPGEVIRLGDVRKNYAIYWPLRVARALRRRRDDRRRPAHRRDARRHGDDDDALGDRGRRAAARHHPARARRPQDRGPHRGRPGDALRETCVKDGKVSGGLTQAKTPAEIATLVGERRAVDASRRPLGEDAAQLATMSNKQRQLRSRSSTC